MKCGVCECDVTLPFRNPLDPERKITCWYCADYYYVVHPERLEEAKKNYQDKPNFERSR